MSSSIEKRIRFARLRDPSREKVGELAECMAAGEPDRYAELLQWSRDEFAALDHENRAYVVAEDNNKIIGFVRIWHSPYIQKWVNDGMVVMPDYMGRGIGSRLVVEAAVLAREMGATTIYSHIAKNNTASRRIHEKAGFYASADQFLNSYGQPRDRDQLEYRLDLVKADEAAPESKNQDAYMGILDRARIVATRCASATGSVRAVFLI